MNDIIKFSNDLNYLIEDYKRLKEQLERTEEWLKLAISVNGSLPFRTKENVSDEDYNRFINNTRIVYAGMSAGGMGLIWSNAVPVDGFGYGFSPVTIDEIEQIFKNGKK